MAAVIVDENEIVNRVALNQDAVKAVEGAFTKLASGQVIMPPVMQLTLEDRGGQTCIKSGYVKGNLFYVIKLASIFDRNGLAGLPGSSGLMLVLNAQTGFVDTVLLDNGYLTAIRTAAAGAIAAKYLAPPDASIATIIGAGKQARLQLQALLLVRKIQSVRVWARDHLAAQGFARQMYEKIGIPISVFPDIRLAVNGADIVVTTTSSRAPILQADWITQGTHVTAMGSDAPGKTELDPSLLAKADHYICDDYQQCRVLGELEGALHADVLGRGFKPKDLGKIISRKHRFKRRDDDITVCDLTGLGVQDVEIALLAHRNGLIES